MSLPVKVTVTRYGGGRHRIEFDKQFVLENFFQPSDISDGLVLGKTYRVIQERLAQNDVADDIKLCLSRIRFVRPQHVPLDHIIATLLDLLAEVVGDRTFVVYMPRKRS